MLADGRKGETEMSEVVRLSIGCTDRVGLVSAIAARLFDLGVNLGDGTFATLGEGAEFVALCELPPGVAPSALEAELAGLPLLAGATIAVTPFRLGLHQGDAANVTHEITCIGPDQPGLLARMTEVLVASEANIVGLVATRLEGQDGDAYRMVLSVGIPADRVQVCLATLANTANQLGQRLTWRAAAEIGGPGG